MWAWCQQLSTILPEPDIQGICVRTRRPEGKPARKPSISIYTHTWQTRCQHPLEGAGNYRATTLVPGRLNVMSMSF